MGGYRVKYISLILCIIGFIFLVSASITNHYNSYAPIAIILIGCASFINGLRFLKMKELHKSGKYNIFIGIVMIVIGCITLGI